MGLPESTAKIPRTGVDDAANLLLEFCSQSAIGRLSEEFSVEFRTIVSGDENHTQFVTFSASHSTLINFPQK